MYTALDGICIVLSVEYDPLLNHNIILAYISNVLVITGQYYMTAMIGRDTLESFGVIHHCLPSGPSIQSLLLHLPGYNMYRGSTIARS